MDLLPGELKTPPLGAVALVGLPSVHASISSNLRSELRPPLHRRVRVRVRTANPLRSPLTRAQRT